ncbi:MAG: hypothetical protein OXC61_10770 [Flavobacteriaceae bacterium]|nr:hypothetical protein [Flavobacteriaceae bacterium]
MHENNYYNLKSQLDQLTRMAKRTNTIVTVILIFYIVMFIFIIAGVLASLMDGY